MRQLKSVAWVGHLLPIAVSQKQKYLWSPFQMWDERPVSAMPVAKVDDAVLTLLIFFSSLTPPLQDGCKEIPNSLLKMLRHMGNREVI